MKGEGDADGVVVAETNENPAVCVIVDTVELLFAPCGRYCYRDGMSRKFRAVEKLTMRIHVNDASIVCEPIFFLVCGAGVAQRGDDAF